MRLRAHANVVSLTEERRERERQAAERMFFIGWQAAPADAPPAPPAKRWRASAIWASLGLGKRSRLS